MHIKWGTKSVILESVKKRVTKTQATNTAAIINVNMTVIAKLAIV
jgi:hypothetical protein